MIRSTFFALVLGLVSSVLATAHAQDGGPTAPQTSPEASYQRTTAMKIRIGVGDKIVTASLIDNATSRDFVSLLPISLTLKDYADTEKGQRSAKKIVNGRCASRQRS